MVAVLLALAGCLDRAGEGVHGLFYNAMDRPVEVVVRVVEGTGASSEEQAFPFTIPARDRLEAGARVESGRLADGTRPFNVTLVVEGGRGNSATYAHEPRPRVLVFCVGAKSSDIIAARDDSVYRDLVGQSVPPDRRPSCLD